MDISSMLEVQVKEEIDVKENVTPSKEQTSSTTNPATAPISQEENSYYKLIYGNDIASVRFRKIHCTACDTHIGSAPSQIHNMYEHPVLRVLVCERCHDFYGDGCFEQGDDATDMFCRWCANGGNLYCCSYCSNTFCYRCIKRNFASLVRKKIEADDKWKCFVCNPSDLYSARAMCWALLQHVQTVTRILAHDTKMSAQDIEEKMNFDESSCCLHRSKRKRRRLESNSDEDDDVYQFKINGVSGYAKRRLRKLKSYSQSTNGTVTEIQPFRSLIPIRPRPASFLKDQSFNAESPNSAANHEKSTVNSEVVLPSPSVVNSSTSLPSRFDSSALQQQTLQQQSLQQQTSLYHASFMNTSGSTAYIQTPVTVNPTRIILPPQPQMTSYQSQQASSYQPQQVSLYQPQQASLYQSQQTSSYQSQQTSTYQPSQSLQSLPNTMVSIPSPLDNHGRSVFLLPKSKELNETLTPNIIELDSDSDDEPKLVTQQNNSTASVGTSIDIDLISEKVVPVALTWENNDDVIINEEQPLTEIRATVEKEVSFSEMMLPHNQELDKLLGDAKKKMHNLFELNNPVGNIDVEAQQKIKCFYHNIRDTIFQLVHINDRIVRQYSGWKRSRKTETEASSSTNKKALMSQEDISLDMRCVNDSDTESECESQVMEISDLVKNSSVLKDLLVCKTNVVHCGVGDDSVHSSMDKAIQVYDIVSRDYEECIGYSVCTSINEDSKTEDSISNLPAKPDKNSNTYEEQFIFYLQHIENNSLETESTKRDSDETSLQEVIETTPSVSFQDIDLSIESIDNSDNCQKMYLNNDIDLMAKEDKTDTMDKNNEEIVNNCGTNIQKTNMQLDDELEQIETQKTHTDMIDNKVVIISDNEANSNKNDIINTEVDAFTESERDCSIIEN